MKNLTTKPAPLDYIEPRKPWNEFWPELWSHEFFGILFIALAIGFTVFMILRDAKTSDGVVIITGFLGAATGFLWLLTA